MVEFGVRNLIEVIFERKKADCRDLNLFLTYWSILDETG